MRGVDHFADPANIRAYAALTEGLCSETYLAAIRAHVAPGAAVLELGSGPGHDLARLKSLFRATGSDKSVACVNYVRETQPDVDMCSLDARTLAIEGPFAAIVSNKTLDYLNDEELKASFVRQARLLDAAGMAIHTLRRGRGRKKELALSVHLRESATLEGLLPGSLSLASSEIYSEVDLDDSLLITLRAAG